VFDVVVLVLVVCSSYFLSRTEQFDLYIIE